MKITIGDSGGEEDEPRWLLHGFAYTPKDPDWTWRQWWLGWGDHTEVRNHGWHYGGMVHYRKWHLGRLWISSAWLVRRTAPFRPSQARLKSDEPRSTPRS